jgi:hypothetical protein
MFFDSQFYEVFFWEGSKYNFRELDACSGSCEVHRGDEEIGGGGLEVFLLRFLLRISIKFSNI